MSVAFSVIIPVYNRASTITRAIDSVLSQSYAFFELVIVDDGSTDATKKIIMSYDDTRIRYVQKKNGGVSSARNAGIKISHNDYIAFLDSDDQWLSHKLETDAAFIRKNPDYVIFQSDEIWVRNGVRVNKKKVHQKIADELFHESLKRCMVSPSSVVMHKTCFERYGYFDEAMKVCEDYDLWLRIARFEKVGLIQDETVIKYGGHADQLSRSAVAIDRYRLYALAKLYLDATTKPKQKELTMQTIESRSRIVANGALKRGNSALAELTLSLALKLKQNATLQDCLFLLPEQSDL